MVSRTSAGFSAPAATGAWTNGKQINPAIDNTNRVTRQRRRGGRAESGTGAHVEARTVQWADQAMPAQATFVQTRVGVAADVVDGVDPIRRMHEEHMDIRDLDAAHLTGRQFGCSEDGNEGRISHQ